MMKGFVIAALLLAAGPVWAAKDTGKNGQVPASRAAASDRIVAVVNDQVVTLNQLSERVALNLRQLGLTNASDAQRSAVMKRTLSGLLDEELQRQFAATNGIEVNKADAALALKMATEAVGGPGNWQKLIAGLDRTAQDKLRAEALWQKIMVREIRPRVQVGTAEVDRLIAELAKSRHVLERQISIIQLDLGEGAGDKAQLAKLKELKEKLAKGEDFDALARAYSEDKSAANGGELGWFAAGELNPQLEEAMDKMQPGQVSDPIRTPIGWYLVKLDNVRTTKPIQTEPVTQLELFMVGAPLPKDEKDVKALRGKLKDVAGAVRKPADVRAYFEKKSYGSTFAASSVLGWVVQGDLQDDLQKALQGVKVGRWSDDVVINGNLSRVYVADTRQALPAKLQAYRDRVMENLYANRVELEARRFMQMLRQRSFVDVRL